MDPGFLIFIFIGFAALVIFGAIHSHRKARERTAALAAWAASKQLYFHADKVRGFDDEHPGLKCLHNGSNRYAYNITSGQAGGHTLSAFDYHYETHSTDSKGNRQTQHHTFSAIILQPPHPLKPLLIRPENFFDKIKAGFGFDDIDFESAEFSRQFYVSAADKRWAYDVIHTRTMEMLLANQVGFTVECDHQALCVYSSKCLDVAGFDHAYQYGAAILDGIPDYARQAL